MVPRKATAQPSANENLMVFEPEMLPLHQTEFLRLQLRTMRKDPGYCHRAKTFGRKFSGDPGRRIRSTDRQVIDEAVLPGGPEATSRRRRSQPVTPPLMFLTLVGLITTMAAVLGYRKSRVACRRGQFRLFICLAPVVEE